MKPILLLALCFLAINAKVQTKYTPLLTYKLLNTYFADTSKANQPLGYTVWKVDTAAKKLYWYEEHGSLNDYYNSKVSDTPRRVLAIQIMDKTRWQIEYKPDYIDSNGGQGFNYGMIIGTKIFPDKIKIYERNSFIPPYFYYENNKANELTKVFIKNPMITFVARHWVNTVETPKIKNGIQYQRGFSGRNMKFGRNLFFEIDGSFTDNHNARCGLDGNIHRYIGKWKLAENNIIEIYDLVEENNKAHSYSIYPDHSDMIVLPKGKFKILKIDNQIMNLQIIENYEQKAKFKVKKARTDK